MSDLIPVRLSHLLRYCSVGAVVRGPSCLMTVKDIREWTDRNGVSAGRPICYTARVRKALGIEEELREPPIAKKLDNGQIEGVCVPAMRFPSWMQCPACGLLHYKPWMKGIMHGEIPRCEGHPGMPHAERPTLEQVPWILVHEHGHMADVPWHRLAHRDAKNPEQRQCRADLQAPCIHFMDDRSDPGRHFLRCETCKAGSAFQSGMRMHFGKGSRQPWLSRSEGSKTPELDMNTKAEVVEVNDVRVHFPVTRNALVIPPESRVRRGTAVDRLYSSPEKRRQIERARNERARRSAFRLLASEYRCAPADIEQAWEEIQKGYPLYGESVTPGLLLESEYRALIDEKTKFEDDEDFVPRHHTAAWKTLERQNPADYRSRRALRSVSRLAAVTRLKEIQVLTGFRRVDPENGELVPPNIDGKSGWLPSLELFGEGIFFTVDEGILARWEEHPGLQERAALSRNRFNRARLPCDPRPEVTPRFILLHTLAHLLIRRLECQSGYPAASLKERIYCAAGKEPMSGILIYVAVADVAGSLGGLAELAESCRFLAILTEVFEHADWCSLDPVCSEQEGQGPQLLNGAACHACALTPEPSCAYGNALLDRTFVKGDLAGTIPAFLEFAGSPT